jgi:hypothetical protein
MKYFTALPLAAALASAEMQVMSLAPAVASGAMTHTVSKILLPFIEHHLTRNRLLLVDSSPSKPAWHPY